MTGTDESDGASVTAVGGTGTAVAPAGSTVRRIGFRAVAWVTGLGFLGLGGVGLLEVALMWLPDDVLVSTFDDATLPVHRGHFNSLGIVAWALIPAVVVQLRRPQRRVAAMLQAVAVVLAGTVLYGLSGSLTDWVREELVLLIPVLLLVRLHPRAGAMLRRPRLDRTMVGMVAVAAVPWLVFAFDQALLQWRNVAGDSHAADEHWATVALMAVAIMVAGLIGSSDHTGWRLPAWFAALASVEYGLHSLVFPEVASAASTVWAAAAVAWGCAYAVVIVRRSRRPVRVPAVA